LNTDSEFYGGTNVGNVGGVEAKPEPWHDQPFSAEVTLPPLGVVWLVPESR
jgi:1,4-alpha-glucan branching enzyme